MKPLLDGFDRVERTVVAAVLATSFVMPPFIARDILLEIRGATAPQGTTDLSIVPKMKAAAAIAPTIHAMWHLMAFDIFSQIRNAATATKRASILSGNLTPKGCPGTLYSTDTETCCEYGYFYKLTGEERYVNQCCGSAGGTVCVESYKPRSSAK